MAYLAPIHRASSVRHSLKLCFLEPEQECLVVAKANRLEFYEIVATEETVNLSLKYTRTLYGKISMLESIHPVNSPTHHLFVGTDRHQFFTLSWDASQKQLRTEKEYVDLSDKTGRDSQTMDKAMIDPQRNFLTLELFEGTLTLIPLTQRTKKNVITARETLGEPVQVRIPEMFVRSSAYLHSPTPGAKGDKPRLVLLYEDNQQSVKLQVKSLDFTRGTSGEVGVDLDDEDGYRDDIDNSASHVMPVPGPYYGFLLLAETCITYFNNDLSHTRMEPLDDPTIFVAWEQVEDQRWLLADEYGSLYFIMLVADERGRVQGFQLDLLGKTSRASSLTYLDGGYVFIGSHQGDSQLIQIVEGGLVVPQTFSNIAPILDFTIMDMGSRAGEGQTSEYSSGQARIVTGSGAFQDGSLRSVRSGVGLEVLGELGQYEHSTSLFALRTGGESSSIDMLAISFVDQTRLLKFSSEGHVEELQEYDGFELAEQTVFAANISANRLLQCTNSGVRVFDLENGMVTANWLPPQGLLIVAASANSTHLALSLNGVEAAVLALPDLGVIAQKKFSQENQISCIEVPDIMSGICLVGFWQTGKVSVLNVDGLSDIQTIQVSRDPAAMPRSILLTQIIPNQPPTLLIAMADGNIVSYKFSTTEYSLSGRKNVILGTQEARFSALPRGDGLYNVFATCEHPTLIYASEGRVVYSAVNADQALYICPFDSEAWPGAIAIATPTEIKLALVDTERTTHVQTLPIGDTVRRIAYSTSQRAFGLGTVHRTLKEGVEIVQSHFKLADEVVFGELDTYDLNEEELVESVIRADLVEDSGDTVERFVVGTAYLDDNNESVRGRILVFEVTSDRKLKVVAEHAVKGACRVLNVMDGKIVAGLVRTVVIYSLEYGKLNKVSTYRTSTAPIDITVTGNIIAVADLMKSVSVVEYVKGTAGEPDVLREVARHYQIAWSTALAPIDDKTYLESDAEGNLMILKQNTNGATADDRRRLEITSEIRLGEMVNRIRPINVPTTENAYVVPRAFVATVEGSIYLFALIAPEKQDFLMRLQAKLATVTESPGNVPFSTYRAFKNTVREAEEPFRFVDGELIERFLDCSREVQDEIVRDVRGEGDVEDVKAVVERLRRLH